MIYVVTGGQRSGKSMYAEQLALSLSPTPIYLATSIPADDDFKERVKIHQQRRGTNWSTIEEPIALSKHHNELQGNVVLVDCITLWLTNIFFSVDGNEDVAMSREIALKELEKLYDIDATFILVTNEIGLGGVSMNATQRRFTDLQGYINQHIAHKADKVTFMVSGLPLQMK